MVWVYGLVFTLVLVLGVLWYTTPNGTNKMADVASNGAEIRGKRDVGQHQEIINTFPVTEDELLDRAVLNILREEIDPPALAASPSFADLTLVGTLPETYIPLPLGLANKDPRGHGGDQHKKRLIVVGDIHGMKEELQALLDKLHFDKEKDHLVCAGDMINKGPDSVGVVELLMSIGASAVRGNHEDRILLAWNGLHRHALRLVPESLQRPISDSGQEVDALSNEELDKQLSDIETFSRSKEYKDRVLAKQFSQKQIKWLQCHPVILNIGKVDGLGQVVVVHGGIVPGLKLQKQDPYAVMNMRTIDLETRTPSEGHKGVSWTKLFNRWQRRRFASRGGDNKMMTVVYGHDSRRGLRIKDYSKGLDSGCLKGGRLTAFVMEEGERHVKTEFVSVGCRDK